MQVLLKLTKAAPGRQGLSAVLEDSSQNSASSSDEEPSSSSCSASASASGATLAMGSLLSLHAQQDLSFLPILKRVCGC